MAEIEKTINLDNADWENVLNEININSLPVQFLNYLKLNLVNGQVNIIDCKSILRNSPSIEEATKVLNQHIRNRKNTIASIDFSIDVVALQKNVEKLRNKFTKKVNFKIKREGKKGRKNDKS